MGVGAEFIGGGAGLSNNMDTASLVLTLRCACPFRTALLAESSQSRQFS